MSAGPALPPLAVALLGAALLAWPDSAAATRLAALGPRTGGSRVRELLGRVPTTPAVLLAGAAAGLAVAGPLQAGALVVLLGAVLELRSAAAARRREAARILGWERALDRAVAAVAAGAEGPSVLAEAAGAAGPGGARAARPGDDAGRQGVVEVLTRAHAVARLGGSAGESLRSAQDPEARGLGAALLLAERRGVPLAGVLEGTRADVAARRERAGRVEAALAGPRATAAILTALPFLGGLLGTGLGAGPWEVLTGGLLGGALALAGAVLLAAGLLWTERIVAGAGR